MTSEVTSVHVYKYHLDMVKPRRICVDGAKRWWDRKGLSWNDFIANGIPGQVLLDTGCALAARVVRAAELEAENGR